MGGAAFDADETEFTLTVVVSALVNFDATQTYQLRFGCISHRVSAGSPATTTITAGTPIIIQGHTGGVK